jgi:hypothetical protein
VMDMHGPPTRVSDTTASVGTSMQQGAGSRGQSLSRSIRDTFEDIGGVDKDEEAEEIGLPQLEDTPLMQLSQPTTRRQHRPRDPYTLGTDTDEDITPLDTNNNPPLNVQGPITRARTRQLNLEVSSFLNSSSYDYENRLLPNDYIVIRNHGEGQGIFGEGLGGVEDQQGHTSQEGGPNQLTWGLFLGSRSSLR